MHFTGTMDHWDPAVTDGFAQEREVILFDNAGISSSSGEVPTSIEEMAPMPLPSSRHWPLPKSMCLGFRSRLVAQEISLAAAKLVPPSGARGYRPRGGEGMATLTPERKAVFWHQVRESGRCVACRILHAFESEPGGGA